MMGRWVRQGRCLSCLREQGSSAGLRRLMFATVCLSRDGGAGGHRQEDTGLPEATQPPSQRLGKPEAIPE